jgi:hypothetical protein
MSLLNFTRSSCSSYLLSVLSLSSELDVEQSSSSAKDVSILPKQDSPVYKIEQSGFPRLADFASSF